MNDARRNNRLYVRLISPSTGTVVGGTDAAGAAGHRCGRCSTPTVRRVRAGLAHRRRRLGAASRSRSCAARASSPSLLRPTSDRPPRCSCPDFVSSAAVAAAVVAATSVVAASGPAFWTVATAAELLKGTSDGVIVSLDGVDHRRPADSPKRLTSTPAQIWSLAAAPDGTLWAGTGGDGRVIRLRPGQRRRNGVRRGREATSSRSRVRHARVRRDRPRRQGLRDRRRGAGARVLRSRARSTSGRSPSTRRAGCGSAPAIRRSSTAWTPTARARSSIGRRRRTSCRSRATRRAACSPAPNRPGGCIASTPTTGRSSLLDSGLTELRAIAAGPGRRRLRRRDQRKATTPSSSGGESASVAIAAAPPPTPGAADSRRRPAARPSRSLYRIDATGTWETFWETHATSIYDLAATATTAACSSPAGRRAASIASTATAQVHAAHRRRREADHASVGAARGGDVPVALRHRQPRPRDRRRRRPTQSPATYTSPVRDTKSVVDVGTDSVGRRRRASRCSRARATPRRPTTRGATGPARTRARTARRSRARPRGSCSGRRC